MRFLIVVTAALALVVPAAIAAPTARAGPAPATTAAEPIPAESPPDSIVWLPPVRVYVAAAGVFGQPLHIPDAWRIEARIWAAAPARRLFAVLTTGPEAAPRHLPAMLTRRLAAPRPGHPRPPAGFAAFTDTLGCRFVVLRALASGTPVRDARRRTEFRATAVLDSATVAGAGAWVTAFDADGRRTAAFRLEVKP